VTLHTFLLILGLVLLLSLAGNGFFLRVRAKLARVPNVAWKRLFGAVLVVYFIGLPLALANLAAPQHGAAAVAEIVASLLVTFLIVKWALRASLGKTILVLVNWAVLQVVVFVPLLLLSRWTLLDSFEIPAGPMAPAFRGWHLECPCSLLAAVAVALLCAAPGLTWQEAARPLPSGASCVVPALKPSSSGVAPMLKTHCSAVLPSVLGVLLCLSGGCGLPRHERPPLAPAPLGSPSPQAAAPAAGGKLRILAFGAHPDDCEIQVGGVAALWAKQGHHVKFVSLTNGDIGHWREAGGPLARRRLEEVQGAAKKLGITTEVLDVHDGELLPTIENRRAVTRLIREWKADVVLGPRPNDYHPDHRYAGVLVQDAAYMVTVPFFCPDEPHLEKNPVFVYYADRFQRPNPFRADVVVPIDEVVDEKLDALGGMESQFFEGGANGHAGLIPKDEAGRAARHEEVRRRFRDRFSRVAESYRDRLSEAVGAERARTVKYAEAFELCEYGSQPSPEELRGLFPLGERR
jgi:LmbE family N-acetylglucosaminyl deacetylase